MVQLHAGRVNARCVHSFRSNRAATRTSVVTFSTAAKDPIMDVASAWAPATVANLGPGFDWMGCAVEVRRLQRFETTLQCCCCFMKLVQAGTVAAQDMTMSGMQGEGDTVTARALPGRPGEVVIEKITGDGGRLTLVAEENCVGIAAIETLKLIGPISCGIGLTLHKVRRRHLPPSTAISHQLAPVHALCSETVAGTVPRRVLYTCRISHR